MLRPWYLFALEAASHEQNWFMKYCGSGALIVVLYICRSALKCGNVSELAASELKNTEATTDFSSSSMPALAAACLTMACVFCRGALIEVWKTNFSRLPSLTRTPSGPRL